jgi:hypothetical protein
MREKGYPCFCFGLELGAEIHEIETEEAKDYFFTLSVEQLSYTPEKEIEAIAQFIGSEQFEWIFVGEIDES